MIVTSKLTLDPAYPFVFELDSQDSAGGPNGGPEDLADWNVSLTGDLGCLASAWEGKSLDELDGSELAAGQELTGPLSGGVASGGVQIGVGASFVYTVKSYSAPFAGITPSDDNWTTPTFLVLDVYAHDDTSYLTVNGTLSFTAAKTTEYESCDPCNGQGGLFGCE